MLEYAFLVAFGKEADLECARSGNRYRSAAHSDIPHAEIRSTLWATSFHDPPRTILRFIL